MTSSVFYTSSLQTISDWTLIFSGAALQEESSEESEEQPAVAAAPAPAPATGATPASPAGAMGAMGAMGGLRGLVAAAASATAGLLGETQEVVPHASQKKEDDQASFLPGFAWICHLYHLAVSCILISQKAIQNSRGHSHHIRLTSVQKIRKQIWWDGIPIYHFGNADGICKFASFPRCSGHRRGHRQALQISRPFGDEKWRWLHGHNLGQFNNVLYLNLEFHDLSWCWM